MTQAQALFPTLLENTFIDIYTNDEKSFQYLREINSEQVKKKKANNQSSNQKKKKKVTNNTERCCL